ncbi:hypothetical protein AJ80_06874 [Polytolypa hystricis UAMH7299]|uniref:Uncharacterized protein n=1 Tax=Polytolypa hystricis (strain UAMH7299) TaxID=1447883 RepID=A0A2B7XSY3_POLH7|nr:hypothetical protein AJ80_06874 [Polytolypa hystricis UAMH7299]
MATDKVREHLPTLRGVRLVSQEVRPGLEDQWTLAVLSTFLHDHNDDDDSPNNKKKKAKPFADPKWWELGDAICTWKNFLHNYEGTIISTNINP